MAELHRLAALQPDWRWSRSAVIAREWKYLEPVRSYCELNGIPVQMADEQPPNFWRLRETQALVDWLRQREAKLVTATNILDWLATKSVGTWGELLEEAVQEYALETGGAELPSGHFLEWLAEWGREVRRRQTGLMLLTAHRAKGLEFDHVAILDGGWQQVSKNEDRDAPRRLFYVAMTRARQTLALARLDPGNAFIDQLPASRAIVRRARTELAAPRPELSRQYSRLTLGDVDLGFAGRHAAGDLVHRAIAGLTTGDVLRVELERERWKVADAQGRTVGRLARSYAPPAGMKCLSARVAAIVLYRREDSAPDFQPSIRCDQWEVVVPELVFAPGA